MLLLQLTPEAETPAEDETTQVADEDATTQSADDATESDNQ